MTGPSSPRLADLFIAVSGNIGVGKSTLVERLAAAVGSFGILESHEDNRFLVPFYADPERWAFQVQAGFVALSAADYESIRTGGKRAVLERTLEEHHQVFATELHSQGLLSADELELLQRLSDSAAARAGVEPDLLIYLGAPAEELDRRVRSRDRAGESSVTLEYLTSLNHRYDEFAADWETSPIVRVDTVAIDVRTDKGLEQVIEDCLRMVGTQSR